MGIILNYDDLDLHKNTNKEFVHTEIALRRKLCEMNDKDQMITINFSFGKYDAPDSYPLYDNLSESKTGLLFVSKLGHKIYKDGTAVYGGSDSKDKLLKLLLSNKLSDQEKASVMHVSNIFMFYEKYDKIRVGGGTKKQEDFIISKFYPYLDFTRPLEYRTEEYLKAGSFMSFDDKSLLLEKEGLSVDVLPDGTKYNYHDALLRRTMNPIDLQSFVDSWNVICNPDQKIELINCPGHELPKSVDVVKELLDLGNDFYDDLKAKDAKSIVIEEI